MATEAYEPVQDIVDVPPELAAKVALCQGIIRSLGRVVVAFSAGVDSTFLLAIAARTLGPRNVLAAVGVSPSLPRRELEAARDLAARLGVELAEVPTGELDDPRYAANPAQRCYFCKHDLFTRLASLGESRGYRAIASGANADDVGDVRPGLKAGAELSVHNPLMEAGLTKADIRQLSRRMDLPTWDKPSMACLASRIPYGMPITPERLGRIEQAESLLRELGLRQYRVRDHQTVARIEVPQADIEHVIRHRRDIVDGLKKLGYNYVALDLEGFRSGSMNETL